MRKSNYDKSPSTTVDGALWKGWESVLDKLKDVCNVPEELAPVSYTHLDVYKRQSYEWSIQQ